MTDFTPPPVVDRPVRRLMLVLGDQLDPRAVTTFALTKDDDALLMIECAAESTHVPSHVQRTVLFLSAMRHYAADRKDAGWRVEYVTLDNAKNTHAFDTEIARALRRIQPEELVVLLPGERRVIDQIESACEAAGVPLRVEEDPHFLCTIDDFRRWAEGRKSLTMEYFYREMRKRTGHLMDGDNPAGGEWNFDKQNRGTFRQQPDPPDPPRFDPDGITREVFELVKEHLPDLPGSAESFAWPVTSAQATRALDHFIEHRLPSFGTYQDAMWTGQRTLYHSVLSPAFNLKLLDPRDAIEKAISAYESGDAPINSVEGFVRQLLGWREFIRGVYWTQYQDPHAKTNALGHHGDLPEFYWTADTDMACMRDALSSVIEDAYGHHIARLMITGNFALIAGVHPGAVNDWYLGMYADAVEWVTEPNTLGMSQHADGGIVGTKPYISSGKYVSRMSNYCKNCRYDLNKRAGEDACPFNVFYWDFLRRHRGEFKSNRRMTMMLKNLDRLDDDELVQITSSARSLRSRFGIGGISR